MSDVKKKRKISIVIEETDGKPGEPNFLMYMDGDIERFASIKKEQMSVAEFVASNLFMMCSDAVHKSGMIQQINGKDVPKAVQ